MKIKIVSNKYLNAVLLLMLFSAIVHMAILFFLALTTGNVGILNYFSILQLDRLFGGGFDTIPAGIISVLVATVIYGIILICN